MLTRLLRIIRGICDDNLETKIETHEYTTSKVFTLLQDNAQTLLSTLIDGAVLGVGQSATLDTSTNKITVVATLTSGQQLQFQFTYYSNFSDTQLKAAIESALTYISIAEIKDFYYNATTYEVTPYATKKEEYLIALIAAIILKPNYSSYRTSTIDIKYPETKSKEQKIQDVMKNYKFSPELFFNVNRANPER